MNISLALILILFLQYPTGEIDVAMTEDITPTKCELIKAIIKNDFLLQEKAMTELEAKGIASNRDKRMFLISVTCEGESGHEKI